ncbi:hypothetical protein A3H89_01685 [Candidatus Amesbacteria bacterium RIFCSPLOWO2_02_FULL_48_11]|uniref:DUF5666 domain-containing protein n=2 Tax=Candidatus Amesiibacteriota TaxID=1752730 RepID=A0A1F4ZA83_9BACT|nr:MAG: hypothetical protein UY33_C0017G0011 [Candidatus Amesbacteria bacterium GW2011_GWA1_48_9]OGC90657.1 MAG: hypothetical protein A2V48_04115 [Candidatus Amesbacteria bacterium RBG_19FT_COMBO_48_16]OGC96504.1 MAG: hypothetical protein A3C34_04725 [Candidatus Amesbacteria bacterium RIFCSPHIGHO2_02_FULL_48_21]OGD00639.1 MAG: hypothetical protein A2702_00555 [Candidatus Amesbacteria bacterium RIFCSPHIGHO2_01_FULL_48_75]OGD01738.1 MAG: hypothetical protein A2354_02540 [Candidatus Amesbacteria b
MQKSKNISFLLLLFTIYYLLSGHANAQTPTATDSGLRDTIKKQVAEELSQIKKAVTKKAYVGSISAKLDATVTIANLKNQSRQATVTTDTAIKLATGKDGTPADLKVGDFVIAMGDVDGSGLMTAKRLIVTPRPPEDKRQVLFGTVTKTASGSLTLEHPDKKTITLKISSITKYSAKSKFTDIKIGTKLIFVADSASALLIHLIP